MYWRIWQRKFPRRPAGLGRRGCGKISLSIDDCYRTFFNKNGHYYTLKRLHQSSTRLEESCGNHAEIARVSLGPIPSIIWNMFFDIAKAMIQIYVLESNTFRGDKLKVWFINNLNWILTTNTTDIVQNRGSNIPLEIQPKPQEKTEPQSLSVNWGQAIIDAHFGEILDDFN